MKIVLMFIIMLFLHVFADYHLQGILAQMKQADKWPKKFRPSDPSANVSMYRNDYKAALAAHAFEWAFVITLPCLFGIYNECADFSIDSAWIASVYIMLLMISAILHYIIDDLKANDHKISLVEDQLFHVSQIILVCVGWALWIGW